MANLSLCHCLNFFLVNWCHSCSHVSGWLEMCPLPRTGDVDDMLFKLGLQTYRWKAMWRVAWPGQRSLQDPNQKFNLEDLSKDLALFLRILEDHNKGLCKDFNENWRILIFTDRGNIVAHAEFHFCCLIKKPYWITNMFKNHTAFEREGLEFSLIKRASYKL